jgi:hypothetical protein
LINREGILMTEKIFENLSIEQKKGLKEYLNENDVIEPLEVIAYCIKYCFTTPRTYFRIYIGSNEKYCKKKRFETNIEIYGAIMEPYNAVPEVICKDRNSMNGFSGNEPFDMIVCQEPPVTDW